MTLFEKTHKIIHTTFNVKRALGFVWESSKGWAVLNVLLLIIQGVLPIVSIYLIKILVDTVAHTAGVAPSGNGAYSVYLVLFAMGCVVLLTGLSRTIGTLVNKEQGRLVVDHMHDIIQKKAVEVDLEYYENPVYQDSLHRAQEESYFRPGAIVTSLTRILRNIISLTGIAWLLLMFKWQVLMLLAAAVFPSMIVRFVFSSREFLNERNYTRKERYGAYYYWMLVGKDLAKEIRLFNLGTTFIERFKRIRTELRNIRYALDKKNAVYSSLAHVFTTVLIFSAYFWVARDAILGLISIGSFVMFYQAFQKGQSFLQGLLEGIAQLYENNLFLSNLYEFLDIDTESRNLPNEDLHGEKKNCSLVLDDIHFTYPSTSKPILNGVNMRIEPGEVAALVGENGSGKTTLVKLICRLYDVDQGTISLNGIDVKKIEPLEIRQLIGVIFQDYAHYNLSVRDNIWFGDINKPGNSPEIEEAAIKAGADAFINRLSKGYDTALGRILDTGEELSEGQWQKVALSRAFFRDTQLIILDEPTSSMDPKAEYELFKGFRKILDGRTALLISHRLSTIRMADKIFVLDKGSIVESGSHEQLVAKNGMYADLFETQAKNYRETERV